MTVPKNWGREWDRTFSMEGKSFCEYTFGVIDRANRPSDRVDILRVWKSLNFRENHKAGTLFYKAGFELHMVY